MRKGCLHKCKRSATTLESRRQVNIPGDNTTVKKREHPILDVVLRDRRRVSKRVISKLFGQYPLWSLSFSRLTLPNSKLLQLNVADAALSTTVGELVGLCDSVLLSEDLVADLVLWVACQKVILLICHQLF